MEKGILINCNEMQVDGILKAAMVNAVTCIEKGAGRKERSDLRRFILECAKILVIYPQDILNNDLTTRKET